MTKKIILDTNIHISYFLFESKIVTQFVENVQIETEIIFSNQLLAEILD